MLASMLSKFGSCHTKDYLDCFLQKRDYSNWLGGNILLNYLVYFCFFQASIWKQIVQRSILIMTNLETNSISRDVRCTYMLTSKNKERSYDTQVIAWRSGSGC